MKKSKEVKTVNEYWSRYKTKIMRMSRNVNPEAEDLIGKKQFAEHTKNLFINQVKTLMKDHDYDLNTAIQKELRSREFTTKAHFYAEGVLNKLMENHIEEIGEMDSRGRFRNSKGQYRTDPSYSIEYMGAVMINDELWTGYSFIAKDGTKKYFYETGSPKTSSYSTMVSKDKLGK